MVHNKNICTLTNGFLKGSLACINREGNVMDLFLWSPYNQSIE
jgi:hypothetical protein